MFDITIDTREQTPWSFDPVLVKTRRGTVPTGDYCVTGDLDFAVERKSLNDFIGTISTGWERFKREIFRARSRSFHMPVIVEARFTDCLFAVSRGVIVPPPHDHPNIPPAMVLKRIGQIEMLGASVRFADGPTEAAMLAASILHARYEFLNNDNASTEDNGQD